MSLSRSGDTRRVSTRMGSQRSHVHPGLQKVETLAQSNLGKGKVYCPGLSLVGLSVYLDSQVY